LLKIQYTTAEHNTTHNSSDNLQSLIIQTVTRAQMLPGDTWNH